ncbi:glycosyltransferase family 39 protein [Flavisolibacter sp. BT320]|nr:glycosyltransferase family 39 protein [Flavisolibacter longurius]
MQLLKEKKEWIYVIGLAVFYILSAVVNLGHLELAGEEPRRAVISIEMLHSGNYIQPTLLGLDYYNKPPLFNWILSFFIWLTGSASAFVLRLPSLIFYMLMAMVHYQFAKRFLPHAIAALSAVFIITCGDVYFYGLANGAEIDIFYGFLVYLQAICIFWFYEQRKFFLLFLTSYLICAIGFLTKGFPSILFQGLTLSALWVYARSVKVVFNWKHILGLFVFAGVLALYFFLYSQYNSPFRYLTNLLNEAFIKSAVGERANRLPEKAAFYPILFLKMLAPWSLLLLLLFTKVRFQLGQNPLVRFSILFIVFNLWVYWFTGQPKIRYVYMFLPFACTILAYIYQRFSEERPDAFNKILRPFGFVFLAAAIAVGVVPFIERTSLLLIILLCAALFAYSYQFFFGSRQRIWLLIAGIILLRLTYAALFIPIQHKALQNYQPIVQTMVEKAGGAPISFKADAEAMPIAINTSLFRFQHDTAKVAPVLSYQVPYYYYLQTGRVMKLDTSAVSTNVKFSYIYQLKEEKRDTLFHFFDWAMNNEAFLYR